VSKPISDKDWEYLDAQEPLLVEWSHCEECGEEWFMRDKLCASCRRDLEIMNHDED
jgi:hypothetical protein